METIIRKMIELAKLVDHKESIDFIEVAEEFLDKEPIKAKENEIIYQVFLDESLENIINSFNILANNMPRKFAKKANNLIASLKNKAANINKRDSRDEIVEYEVPTKILSFKEEARIPTIRDK